jgi:hypothetical protein
MFCNRCGSANTDDRRFCVNCGSPLNTQRQPAESQPQGYSLPQFSQGRPDQPQYPQGYQNYQGYQSGPGSPQPGQSASGKAITAMVLSLVSIVTCGPFLSIPGFILGKQELDAIRRGESPIAGEGFAKVGYWVGIVVTALSCLAGIVYAIILFVALGSAH